MFNRERAQRFEVVFENRGDRLQLQRTPQSVQNFFSVVMFGEVEDRQQKPDWLTMNETGDVTCLNTNENMERLSWLCAKHHALLTVEGESV
jgi:hypothetical protein